MYNVDYSNYFSGLFNMASSCSDYIGPSYVDCDCLDSNNFKAGFAEIYEIPEKELELEKMDSTYEELLKTIFGDNKKIIEGISHWSKIKLGEVQEIYTINELSKIDKYISASEGGLGPFYTLDDIYFIVFKKEVLVLLIGNDE